MQFFPSENDFSFLPAPKTYSLAVIITIILLPPLWFLSFPALFFSEETKKLYKNGYGHIAFSYSIKTKKLLISAWAIFAVLTFLALVLALISHLSLI